MIYFIVKQLLLLLSIFLITLFIQYNDDKKYNKKRISLYDKYNLPIFFTCIIALLLNSLHYFIISDNNINSEYKNNYKIYDQEIILEPMYHKL